MRLLAILLTLYAYVLVAGQLLEFDGDLPWLVIWPSIILIGFASTIVHELGHATAILWAGGRVNRFAVVPFEFRFRPLRATLLAPRSKGDIAGYVAAERGWRTTKRRSIIIAAAGPLADFALAIVAVTLAIFIGASATPAPMPPSTGLMPSDAELMELAIQSGHHLPAEAAAAGLRALALFSLVVGAANLLPFRGSDGQAILRRLQSGGKR